MNIDLNGPDGNAFALLAQAERLGQQLGLDFNSIKQDMMSGDYEHLLDVFEEHFGEHVNLIGRDS